MAPPALRGATSTVSMSFADGKHDTNVEGEG